jgi:hypothetical protein
VPSFQAAGEPTVITLHVSLAESTASRGGTRFHSESTNVPVPRHRAPLAETAMDVSSVHSSYGVTLQDRMVPTCGENAFRYLLDTERRRAERAGRPILLLLVNMTKGCPPDVRTSPAVAASIFRALCVCVREVDFIGWFREGRVAGVVLTQGSEPLLPDAPRRLGNRVTSVLRQHVPSTVAERLQVRVLQLHSATARQAI